jgi:hypothetical protein
MRFISISGMNGFGRNDHPLLSTGIPVCRPEINKILAWGRSWLNWVATSIPVIPGMSRSDKSRSIVPSKS